MNANINRVYVNPNFNRTPTSNAALITNCMYLSNYMHVNPNFTRHLPNVQQNNNPNRKIYVNPNFIKPNTISDNNQYSNNKQEPHCSIAISENFNYQNDDYLRTTLSKTENSKPLQNISPHPSSKSRYRLIRNNNNKLLSADCRVKETSTIKIGKYKSIPIHNFKNSLQNVKNDTPKRKPAGSNLNTPVQKYVNRSCFKFVKHNLRPTINTPLKLTPKNSQKIIRNVDMNLQKKLKVSNGIRKKNNIPCRLFTKYGKCLRNMSGTCKYVHDKKHVSLCRKFIKGICHDTGCLLSHELSSKKMPTCFFYLKGMCTKSNCPYLHVKLSEKSKICLDFLKGYCDKGDTCLHRHIRPHLDKRKDKRRIDNTTNKNTPNKVKLNILKLTKTNQSKRLNAQIKRNEVEPKHENRCENEQVKDDGECRYFKEVVQNEDVACEVLKPTRCKLGILPSFIQL